MQHNYKIYVINLDRSTDRLKHIEAQLNALGLSFERVSAVDGRGIQADQYAAFSQYHHPLEANEIACYLSHVKCWRKIVADGVDFGLVLEDDVSFTEDFAVQIEDVVGFLQQNAQGFVKLSANKIKRKRRTTIAPLASVDAIVKYSPLPVMTKGQIISNPAASWLSFHCAQPVLPIDVLFRYEWLFPFRILNTGRDIVQPAPFGSDIGSARRKKSPGNRFRKFVWRLRFHSRLYAHYLIRYINFFYYGDISANSSS